MKKVILLSAVLISFAFANSSEQELFNTKCAVCHKVDVDLTNKDSLIAPPISKVMMHVKRSFKDKNKAIEFMKDYVINPDPKKTVCPSIDIFGVMPAQKGLISDEELDKVLNYLYDTFPQGNMGQGGKGMGQGKGMGHGGKGMGQGRGMGRGGFAKIDSNNDGFISKNEFKAFRAQREGIDIKKIKYDYFFNRLDKNNDGKLSKDEFATFREIMRGH